MKRLFLLFLFFPIFVHAQWSILFGTEEFTGLTRKNLPEDLPQKIVRNNAGELYITGTSSGQDGIPNENSMGLFVAKFNEKGQLLWYAVDNITSGACIPKSMFPTSDGGVVLSGYDWGYNNQGVDGLWLLKFSSSGKLINKFHPSKSLYINENKVESKGKPVFTFENIDGNISLITTVVVRIVTKIGNLTRSEPVRQTWLINFSQELEFLDAVVLDIPDIEPIEITDYNLYSKFDNSNCPDGSFAIVRKEKPDRKSMSIYKFDKEGNRLWTTDIKHSETTYNFGILHSDKGETVLYYYINENNKPKYLLKTYSSEGNLISERSLFNSDSGVFPSSLSKIIFSGDDIWLINNPSGGEGKIEIKKMSAEGKEYFSKTFGTKGTYILDCVETNDEGIAAVAYTKDYNANYIDALILKLTKDGASTPTVSKYTKAEK